MRNVSVSRIDTGTGTVYVMDATSTANLTANFQDLNTHISLLEAAPWWDRDLP